MHPVQVVDEEHSGSAGVDGGLGPQAVGIGGGVVAEKRLDSHELEQRLADVGDVAPFVVLGDDRFGVEGFGVDRPGFESHEPPQGGGADTGLPLLERRQCPAEVEPPLAALQGGRAVPPGHERRHVRRNHAVVDEFDVAIAVAERYEFGEGFLALLERVFQAPGQPPHESRPAPEERIVEPRRHGESRLSEDASDLDEPAHDRHQPDEAERDTDVRGEPGPEGILGVLPEDQREIVGLGPVRPDERPPEQAGDQHRISAGLLESLHPVGHCRVEEPDEQLFRLPRRVLRRCREAHSELFQAGPAGGVGLDGTARAVERLGPDVATDGPVEGRSRSGQQFGELVLRLVDLAEDGQDLAAHEVQPERQLVVHVPGIGRQEVDTGLDIAGRSLVGVGQLGLPAGLQVELRQFPPPRRVIQTNPSGVEVGDDVEEVLVALRGTESLQQEGSDLEMDGRDLGRVEEGETRLLDAVVEEAVGEPAEVREFEALEDEFVGVARGKDEPRPERRRRAPWPSRWGRGPASRPTWRGRTCSRSRRPPAAPSETPGGGRRPGRP